MSELMHAFSDFFCGLSQAVGAIVLGLNAIAAFNYRLVTAVFQSIHDCGIALYIISSSLVGALVDIIYYIGDFLAEVFQVIYVFFHLVAQFGLLIYHICALCFQGLALVLLWLADECADVIKVLIQCANWCGMYLSESYVVAQGQLTAIGREVAKYGSVVTEKTVSLASETSQVTTGYALEAALAVKDQISSWHHVVIQNFASSLKFVTDSVRSTFLQIFAVLTENVSVEVYVYVVVATLAVLLLRVLLENMQKKGMTFPFLQLRRQEYDLELPPDLHYATSASDDDTSEESESEEDDNIYPSIGVIEEDSEEGEGEVEEYEIASESDEEEEGSSEEEEPISIQISHHGGRYNLRMRSSPGPMLTSSNKRSPDELEKVLENERDKRMCVVCQDQVKNVLIMPCKHMCLCIDCAQEIVQSRNPSRRICPLCRTKIETVMDVYV